MQANKINKSENFFKKCIAINSGFWNSYDFLLNQYEKQSRLEEFIFLFKAAKKIFKGNTKLTYYESLYLYRKKNIKIIRYTFIKKIKKKFHAIQNSLVLADYFHLLSRIYERLGSYDESYKLAIDRNKTLINFNQNKNSKRSTFEYNKYL